MASGPNESVCTGGGGGGSGGFIEIHTQTLATEGPQSAHFDISGGTGGAPNCVNAGTLPPGGIGGDGGGGVWAVFD